MNTTTIQRVQDDRTEEQRQRLTVGVVGRDAFMGAWGPGRDAGGSSACWACEPQHAEKVLAWVDGRDEMRRVRVVDLRRGLPRVRGLLHVYDADKGHPAIGGDS